METCLVGFDTSAHGSKLSVFLEVLMDYASHIIPGNTSQRQPLSLFWRPPEMTENSAGGFSFKLDPWKQFERFLILGTEGGTYYAKEKALTIENATVAVDIIKARGLEAIAKIVEVSTRGLAPKNDAAIFALALACTHGDPATKKEAYKAIRLVCRTGTHLFTFCEAVNKLRGWSRGLRSGVSAFYESAPVDKLAYQLVKYRQRNGWTHKDVFRLAHPSLKAEDKAPLALKVMGKAAQGVHPLYMAFEAAQGMTDAKAVAHLIDTYKLPWEAVPTALHGERVIWEALLPHMGLGALLRNMSRFSKLGMMTEHGLDAATKAICQRFESSDEIKASRLHPISLLNGTLAYAKGHSERSDAQWQVCPRVADTLAQAYIKAFGNVQPTGKNYVLALDVSGSMTSPTMAATALTPREASTAMAMVTLGVEENVFMTAFSGGYIPLPITKRTALADAIRMTRGMPFDTTDCAVPMLWAARANAPVDVFVIYTDNETHSGRIHPTTALKTYRQKMGRDAKLIVCGMTSTGFTIADPKDHRQLDIVGFSLDTPQAISSFVGL
jgi:60 kDa SS-A/Ro ribonucleoprotein